MSTEAQHHKDYRDSSPVIEVPHADILGNADPRKHGLVLQSPGEKVPYASVRPPFFRATMNDPEVHQNDLVRLYTPRVPKHELVIPPATDLTVGSEIELLTIHDEVRKNGHERIHPDWHAAELEESLQKYGVPTSPEVWKYMLEINGVASKDTAHREQNLREIAAAMAQSVQDRKGMVRFLPISSQPFIANPADVNPHPYVQRMVMDFLTYTAVADLGASYQVHVEMRDLDSAIYAVNALRRIPHIPMAMALNGAFLQHEPTLYLSTREQSRRKMSTAGTIDELPDWDECVRFSVGMLKTGKVPSLPRALSQHKDFRIRPDITPHGTIEFAFLDNPGGNIEKMLMIQELFRLSTWRLYQAYQQDEPLPQALFGGKYDNLISTNKSAVERDGADAVIINGEYEQTSVYEQSNQLLDWITSHSMFVENPQYPTTRLATEMGRSLAIPKFTDCASRSMLTFYQSGIGTPGHYQQALYEYYRKDLGLDPTEAINRALVDYADSFQTYLENTTTTRVA